MKICTLIGAMIALFGLITSAEADDGVWQPLNQEYYMNNVQSIDVGYTTALDKYIYASELDAGGKVWVSTNDGPWFDALLPSGNRNIEKVVVQKQDFNYAWALVKGNTYDDADAGPWLYDQSQGRWVLKSTNLGVYKSLYCMGADYGSAGLDRMLIGGGGLAGQGAFVFRTENRGDSWTNVSNNIPGIREPYNTVIDIAYAPSNPQIAYFILFTTDQFSAYRGLYKSVDGGDSWVFKGAVILTGEQANQFSPSALAIDPADPNKVLVGVTESFYASTRVLESHNGGDRWSLFYTLPGGGSTCNAIEFSPSQYYVYMAFYAGNQHPEEFVIRDQYDGLIIEPIPTAGEQPGDKRAFSLAVDPRNEANIYIGTEHMLYRSTDFGTTVQPFVDGANLISNVPCVDADLPNIYSISNLPPFGSIYRSTNYGQSWAVRQSEGIVGSTFIHSDPGQAGLCFAGAIVDGGLSNIYRSLDEGETWAIIPGLPQGVQGSANCFTVDAGSNWVYWGISGSTSRGYYRSSDNGDTWTRYSYNPPLDANPFDIAIHPTQPATIVVADGTNGLYRSLDRGVDGFSPIHNSQTGTNINLIKYCPGQPNIALITTTTGIFKSTDMNLLTPSWTQANYGGYAGHIENMEFHATDNSIVSFCTNISGGGRFFISADTARSWLEFNSGLNGHTINDISIDVANPDTFYAATDDGIFKLKNPVKSGVRPSGEIWGPGTVIINGDVSVPFGSKLTIAPGTTVKVIYNFDRLYTGGDPNKSELQIEGELDAIGDAAHPIVFESSNPALGNWYGIRAETGSDIDMDYCTIRNAVYGIYAYKPAILTVDNCIFESITTAGIYITGNTNPITPIIRNTSISNCGTYGIRCSQYPLTVQGCTITESAYGIYYEADAAISISDCSITHSLGGPTYYGIRASKLIGSVIPTIVNNYIYGFAQGGMYVSGGSSQGLIDNTDVLKCGYGIYYTGTSTPIVSGASTKNLLQENTNGLWLASASSPTVRRTKFLNNASRGIQISTGCQPDVRGISSGEANSFIYSGFTTYYDLYNANVLPIDVTHNYWGEVPPITVQIYNANYVPYILSDPLPRLTAPHDPVMAEDFKLSSVYPNPFNPSATISFNLTKPQPVSVRVYNIMGQEVATVFDGLGQAGENIFVWDGRNLSGQQVAAGVYFCHLRTEASQQTLKMTVLK